MNYPQSSHSKVSQGLRKPLQFPRNAFPRSWNILPKPWDWYQSTSEFQSKRISWKRGCTLPVAGHFKVKRLFNMNGNTHYSHWNKPLGEAVYSDKMPHHLRLSGKTYTLFPAQGMKTLITIHMKASAKRVESLFSLVACTKYHGKQTKYSPWNFQICFFAWAEQSTALTAEKSKAL